MIARKKTIQTFVWISSKNSASGEGLIQIGYAKIWISTKERGTFLSWHSLACFFRKNAAALSACSTNTSVYKYNFCLNTSQRMFVIDRTNKNNAFLSE